MSAGCFYANMLHYGRRHPGYRLYDLVKDAIVTTRFLISATFVRVVQGIKK